MTFQMCFYVLRRTEKPCTDDRFCRLIEDGTRRPIRECRDLDEFEVPDHRPRTDRLRLYQAQHAFVVMFHDKTDQIAYHLVDNSYSRCDPEDKRETAEWYDELMTDGMDPDPCSHGKVDATRLGDPCHFFLTTVTVRLREMTIQWKKTVKDLTLKSAREIDRVRRKVLRRKVRPSKEPLQWDEDARSEKRWNTLKILAETLEDALEELKPRRSDVEHFKSAMDAHGNQALAGYIREINKFRAELDRCVKKLRQQIREEEKLRGDLTERVSLEFQEIARTFSDAQQALQSQIAILGFVMVLLSPVSLTTGIFSVEDKYMPMSRSWRSFILTTVLFWAVILLFWVVSNCFSRVWGKFRGDSECYPSGRKLWRRWLGGGELRKTLDEAVNEV